MYTVQTVFPGRLEGHTFGPSYLILPTVKAENGARENVCFSALLTFSCFVLLCKVFF